MTDGQRDADLPSARERAAKAGQRIQQLQRRRRDLAAGRTPSTDSVDQARRHAEAAMERARDAHRVASAGHEAAARAHERAANTLQRAAWQGHDDPVRLQDEADEHWQAAEDNRVESLDAQAKADDPTKSSSGS